MRTAKKAKISVTIDSDLLAEIDAFAERSGIGNRGHVYWARLPGDKRRPVLVLSPAARNEHANDVIVAPLSTVTIKKAKPTRIHSVILPLRQKLDRTPSLSHQLVTAISRGFRWILPRDLRQ